MLLIALVALPAAAQEWMGLASVSAEFPEDRSAWTEARLASGATWSQYSIVAEAGRVERYDQASAFVGADVYAPLAPRAYGNVRARLAPGSEIAARTDLSAELYAAPVEAWEVSLGARRLAFVDRSVHLATVSAARYAGPWLGRVRLTAIPDDGRVPVSTSVSIRHLTDGAGGPTASFWEITTGRGQEATPEALGATAVRASWFASARVQRRIASGAGVSLGGGYTADGGLSRASAELGVFARW